jgi:hypothetical protein
VIPLNQLIPECLLALGAAFLLGNLAAYVRLRPAWREAKEARGGRRGRSPAKSGNPRAKSGSGRATSRNPRSTSGYPPAESGNPRAKTGTSGRVNARVREPMPSRSLPSQTRVLVNVIIGFVVTIAALAALIRG